MTGFKTMANKLSFLLETDAVILAENLQGADATARPADKVTYRTNYVGSKQRLLDWLWSKTPRDVKTVIDAFSGSAAVAYMYKTKGLAVTTNDHLRIGYHMARAIVENQTTTLEPDDDEQLLAENPAAGTFVQDNYAGLYFHKGVHRRIDQIRANIDALKGYKRDIALFALLRACMLATDHGTFASTTPDTRGLVTNAAQFDNAFRKFVGKINALVFDNGQANKTFHADVRDLMPKLKADLAYFDPPYVTAFGRPQYHIHYHFIEGLMNRWDGLDLQEGKLKRFKSDHPALTEKTMPAFFNAFLTAAQQIPHWLISYRNHGIPNESSLRRLFKELGRESQMSSRDHVYGQFNHHKTDANQAKEHLFLVSKAATTTTAGKTHNAARHGETLHHTRFSTDGRIELLEPDARAQLCETSNPVPRFRCVLCHVGTNRNGDHFTYQALAAGFRSAVNQKINLDHKQGVEDIVGGIVDAQFLSDALGERIEITGELFVADSDRARLAYRLMKHGIVRQVSMECAYTHGECFICGRLAHSKNDYCMHLKGFKGRKYNGKPTFEILHNVTFTGVGLLSKEGADEGAKITQVSAHSANQKAANPGEQTMEPMNENHLDHETIDWKTRFAKIERENQRLSQALNHQKQKARAVELMTFYKENGLTFQNQGKADEEFERLSQLSEREIELTRYALELFLKNQHHQPETKAEAKRIYPYCVDDVNENTENLKIIGDVIMAAYHERIGHELGN